MRFVTQRVPLHYEKSGLPTPTTDSHVRLYLPDNETPLNPDTALPLVVICPGGGYEFTSPREAEPIALQFLAAGMAAIILDYAVAPDRYPTALCEAAATIYWARQNAKEWGIDPSKVFICGFSAGGHLAASLSVYWNKPFVSAAVGCTPADIRPSGSILCYPVITGKAAQRHSGSLQNLYGANFTPEQEAEFCLDEQIDQDTPPAFLWHTADDDVVPVANSMLYAAALQRHNIPVELHIYPHGQHGLSLANPYVTIDPLPQYATLQQWMQHAITWIGLQ